MADEIRPTPRNPLFGLFSDFVNVPLDYMSDPRRTQQMQGIASFIRGTGVPSTLENLSYDPSGRGLFTGAGGLGGTTRMRPEAIEAALTLAPGVGPAARLTRGLPVGASIKNISDKNAPLSNMLLYHGGDLVKNPTPYKQGLFTDGVPGVSFTPNIVEAARYAKHNMGSINAIDASGLKIYQGGNKSLDAAYKAGDFSAIKNSGFDGLKLENSSEYVLFDPEKVLSLPRKVAEQNVNRQVGGNMRQFLDWKDVDNLSSPQQASPIYTDPFGNTIADTTR